MSFRSVIVPREGQDCYELRETEVRLRDTQFLEIGRVLQVVH